MLPVVTTVDPPRALRQADVPARDWQSWRWQLRNMITTADELAQVIDLSPAELDGLARSKHLFRVGITPYYASLMDPRDPTCPVRMQAIPRAAELDIRAEELRDPLGEDSHHPAPCVIHKYPDRALLLVVDRCAIDVVPAPAFPVAEVDLGEPCVDADVGVERLGEPPRAAQRTAQDRRCRRQPQARGDRLRVFAIDVEPAVAEPRLDQRTRVADQENLHSKPP